MDKKLQDKLYKKYPNMFKQRKLPMSQTCMCWGISTGPGWMELIDHTCSILLKVNPEIEFTQMKEKFGQLRIYTDNANEDGRWIINCAELMSACICETCGENGELREYHSWLSTLCDKCFKKHQKMVDGRLKKLKE